MPTHKAGETLVLDTHIWVWLLEGATQLKPVVRRRIEAAARADNLLVSAISVLEVAMLEAKGRLIFEQDCNAWVKDALSAPGISLVPLAPEIAVSSTRLPGDFHGDPADRMIVATARAHGHTLVTADGGILAYATSGNLRVLAAD
ncbi:MAG: type II toxin-antitoxin system VapC family toxin [Verrucomicrobia bacterium]|jgi:PIN domain nuclease of toxin-antitoxin system|nr:type II toxin-antitoxin system VapC family toxin [Verrucomicrobiota bacterium]